MIPHRAFTTFSTVLPGNTTDIETWHSVLAQLQGWHRVSVRFQVSIPLFGVGGEAGYPHAHKTQI